MSKTGKCPFFYNLTNIAFLCLNCSLASAIFYSSFTVWFERIVVASLKLKEYLNSERLEYVCCRMSLLYLVIWQGFKKPFNVLNQTGYWVQCDIHMIPDEWKKTQGINDPLKNSQNFKFQTLICFWFSTSGLKFWYIEITFSFSISPKC